MSGTAGSSGTVGSSGAVPNDNLYGPWMVVALEEQDKGGPGRTYQQRIPQNQP